MMAHAMRDDSSNKHPLTAIDSYTKNYEPLRELFNQVYMESRENFWSLELRSHICSVIFDTADFFSLFWHKPIRMAFIDSSHHYKHTTKEIELVASHLVPGGWMVFDDYFSEKTPGVRQAVDEHIAKSSDDYTVFRHESLIALKRKRVHHIINPFEPITYSSFLPHNKAQCYELRSSRIIDTSLP